MICDLSNTNWRIYFCLFFNWLIFDQKDQSYFFFFAKFDLPKTYFCLRIKILGRKNQENCLILSKIDNLQLFKNQEANFCWKKNQDSLAFGCLIFILYVVINVLYRLSEMHTTFLRQDKFLKTKQTPWEHLCPWFRKNSHNFSDLGINDSFVITAQKNNSYWKTKQYLNQFLFCNIYVWTKWLQL